ncbi:TMEM175 family protein [Arthrobacter sp. Bi26]|uniref:TMEM175 family protein n=1 Tax=Arthrobacter sp. Bi26 TaxID=2822350 RepID=UPI001E3C25B4|nr:TMEM175 family protein [Arthrobacter sp. Bi26]
MVFFSDAVFAIALTLLALDLKLPEGIPAEQLDNALLAAWPQLLTGVSRMRVCCISAHPCLIFSIIRMPASTGLPPQPLGFTVLLAAKSQDHYARKVRHGGAWRAHP